MFQGLRENSLFYILEKGENIKLNVGQVVSVSNPMPKYKSYTSPQPYTSLPDLVVDVKVKVGDEVIDFKQLSAGLSIENSGNLVVSESKDAMCSEVEAMHRNSKNILESISYHEKVLKSCDQMLRELNPQFAKEKEQEEKIGGLEVKMEGIEKTLTAIQSMLSETLDHSKTKRKED